MAIIISNGIDYTLKLGKKWKIYFNKNIKYCFFFNNYNIPKKEEVKKLWENFERESGFPVIEFNQEEIYSSSINLYKYEKLLKAFDCEKYEKKSIQYPEYEEYRTDFSEKLKPEYKEIFEYLSQENQQVYVQINQKEKPSYKITLNSNTIMNCFSMKTSDKAMNCKSFLDEFEKNLPIYNQKIIDDLFPPNKPTLYAPSTKGTKLNFSGLLNFFITKGQENKIWLEKKDRLQKDYRICIIIDSSRSCFNKDSFYFSFNIIKALFNLIYYSKIPYIDIILATDQNPLIICLGQDSNILNNFSFIWSSILSYLYGERSNEVTCNLYDAIYLSLKIKMQQTSKKFYCFVLTDGIFNETYKNELKNLCSFCEYSQIYIYGIGLGLYPEGLPFIFSKCLWCTDIKYFIQAFSSMLKNEKIFQSYFDCKIEKNIKRNILNKDMKEYINKINDNYLKYCTNKILYKYLDGKKVYMESLQEVMNIDPLYKDMSLLKPEKLENKSMFEKGFFKNFKILICCFWSKSISSKLERDEIDYKYLKKRFNSKKKCLADIINYYGIEEGDIKVVVDYEQGVNEMKTGKYYCSWII